MNNTTLFLLPPPKVPFHVLLCRATALSIITCLALLPAAAHAGSFTAGNLVVEVAQGTGNNVTANIQEFTPTGSTAGLQNVTIPGTGGSAFRISASAATSGFLSLSSDQTLLTMTGANSATTSGNENTLAPRAVGILTSGTAFSIATTYSGSSSQQERAATTIDNANYYIADQGGLYTNGGSGNVGTQPSNLRSIRSFGGTVYVCSAATSVVPSVVSVVPSLTATSFTGLAGLSTDSTVSDFYMLSSGSNGTAYDILYILGTAGLKKYSLVSGAWVASGTDANAAMKTGYSIAAASLGSGSASIYISTSNGSASNTVISVTDQAGYNATINDTTPATLLTASASTIFKGLAFAPLPVTISVSGSLAALSTSQGIASSSTSFTISGTSLAGNIIITPPAGFEVSTTGSSSGYAASGTLTETSGTAGTTIIYMRLAAAAATGTYSGNVVCSSTGVPTIYVPTAPSAVNASAAITTSGTSIPALSGTYGTPSASGTFSASGSNLAANITITAPTGFQVSTGSASGYAGSIILTQSGGSVSSTAIYVRLSGSAPAGANSGNISLTSTGAATQNVAVPSSTVSQLALTVSGAAVTTKPWDGTTAAVITGALSGVVNGDTVNFVGTGTFSSPNDGTGIPVTSTSTLSGADAGNYTLTQPMGLAGTITPSANIGSLALSAGSLTTGFASGTTSYAVYLPGNTSSLTLTPTIDSGATVTVDGTSASTPVSLSAGSNTITIVVTPNGGGSTQTYTVTAYVAGPFTQGDLVVTTYGNTVPSTIHPDGPATLITLEEFTPTIVANSTPVMALVLPSTVTGSNVGLVGEYGSSSEGTIQPTYDGQRLTIGGYSAIPGMAYTATALAQSTDTQVPRVVALIDINGNVDTSSVFNDIYNTNNPRCVYSPDDINLYLSGQGAGASDEGGLYYTQVGTNTTAGGAAPAGIFNVVSTRTIFAYQGSLYYSADQNSASKGTLTGIFEYSGLPTTSQSTNTGTRITPANNGGSINYSPDGFFFANSTTLYVADTGDPKAGGTGDGGIQKWVYNGSQWILQYTLTTPNFVSPTLATSAVHGETGFAALAGNVVSGTVYLYATSYTAGDADPDGLYGIADTLSSTTGAGEAFTEIAAAPGIQASGTNPDYVFKGVSLAPIAGPVNSGLASSITGTGVTLNGIVNPGGSDTHVYFQYGTTTEYGMTSGTMDIGSGNSPVSFNLNLTGLAPGTTYDYRLVSDGAITYYANQTFTTSAQSVPAMTPWALAVLAAGLAGVAAFALKRKQRDSAR